MFTSFFSKNYDNLLSKVWVIMHRDLMKLLRKFSPFALTFFTKKFIGINFQQDNKKRKQHGTKNEAYKTEHTDARYYPKHGN